MRISLIYFLVTSISTSSALAISFNSQVLDTPIESMSIKDASFEQAIKQIEQETQVKFVYSISTLHISSPLTVNVSNTTLGALLDQLLKPLQITFKVYENERMITLQKEINKNDNKDKTQGMVPDVVGGKKLDAIKGRVVDATTQAGIAGANILIYGTINGTTTDQDGRFNIEADKGNRLVISFIGYKSQEVEITIQTELLIQLQEDVSSLDEVVVNAGYWDVNKKEQTGNIARITSKDIASGPVGSNTLQAVQGRMAGVYVQQTTGIAGGGFNIQIRGRNSLRNNPGNSGNLPLYIVDGVPFTSSFIGSSTLGNSIAPVSSPLNMINPNDIESIEILKDADATAIYGARGANGVVLITTKKASRKDSQLDVTVQTGIGQVANHLDLLSTKQYLEMRREAFRNDGYTPYLTPENSIYFPDLLAWDTTRYTDWQKKLIGKTAHTTNAQLSFSGGSQKTRFLVGAGLYKETTVFPGNFSYLRGSGHFNLDHTSSDERLNITLSASYSAALNHLPETDLTRAAMTQAPGAPALYDSTGAVNWANNTWDNPIASLLRKYQTSSHNLISNATLRYRILKGLTAKVSSGFTSMDTRQLSTSPIASNLPSFGITSGQSDFGSGNVNTWIVEPQLTYETRIRQSTLELLAGSTLQQSIQESQTLRGTGYTSDALLENIRAAQAVNVIDATYTKYKYAAVFARAYYKIDEKYLINLTGRRDGSSRFGPGHQFANFGAVGVAWIFSSEEFIKNSLRFLSFGKLRSSFGVTGSDQIGDYQYLASYSPTTYPYGGSVGLTPDRLVNPDYRWETNKKFEVGMDLGFLQDRIMVGLSWFMNRSSNQLVGLPLSQVTGQSTIQYNLGATVENSGYELEISSINIDENKFRWTTTFNLTVPKNVLVSYPNIEGSPYANTFQVGKSLYTRKLIHGTGVDPATGLYSFQDLNNNGETLFDTPGDLQALKTIAQTAYGGITNTIRVGSLELSFLIQYVKQTGRGYMESFSQPGAASNQPDMVMQRWKQAGDVTTIQKFTTSPTNGGLAYLNATTSADNNIVDASFVRLKNVSLSWQLPTSSWTKGKISASRLFINGQNLFTLTNYIGLDPETQSSTTLPPLRMINVGIQIQL